jgi:hypothetical protein
MLGVIDHDLTTLSLPVLEPESSGIPLVRNQSGMATPVAQGETSGTEVRAMIHDKFDDDIFSGVRTGRRNEETPLDTMTPGASTPKLSSSIEPPVSRGFTAKVSTPKGAHPDKTIRNRGVSNASTTVFERPANLLKDTKSGATQSETTVPGSPVSVVTGFSTPIPATLALSRRSSHSEDGPGVSTPSATRSLRSLANKPSRSALSSLGYLLGITSRPTPTPPATTLQSAHRIPPTALPDNTSNTKVAETEISSDLHAHNHKLLQPDVFKASGNKAIVSPFPGSRAPQPVATPTKKRLTSADEGRPLGTSQVEPLAIPVRGLSADRRLSRRRSVVNALSMSEEKPHRLLTDRNMQRLRTVDREKNTKDDETPMQMAHSLPSQRGASFPYGNSYKRSYMSSINPCRPHMRSIEKASKARRWQHALPRPTFTQDVKWDSIVAPSCLPLTSDMIPKEEELKSQYHEQLYVFDCQANQLSFLLRPPTSSHADWDLPIEVLREMASQRLSRKFCRSIGAFVLLTKKLHYRKFSIHRFK